MGKCVGKVNIMKISQQLVPSHDQLSQNFLLHCPGENVEAMDAIVSDSLDIAEKMKEMLESIAIVKSEIWDGLLWYTVAYDYPNNIQ